MQINLELAKSNSFVCVSRAPKWLLNLRKSSKNAKRVCQTQLSHLPSEKLRNKFRPSGSRKRAREPISSKMSSCFSRTNSKTEPDQRPVFLVKWCPHSFIFHRVTNDFKNIRFILLSILLIMSPIELVIQLIPHFTLNYFLLILT